MSEPWQVSRVRQDGFDVASPTRDLVCTEINSEFHCGSRSETCMVVTRDEAVAQSPGVVFWRQVLNRVLRTGDRVSVRCAV